MEAANNLTKNIKALQWKKLFTMLCDQRNSEEHWKRHGALYIVFVLPFSILKKSLILLMLTFLIQLYLIT